MNWRRILLMLVAASVPMLLRSQEPEPEQKASVRTVEQWGIFEIELKGPGEGNPFLDVRFSATFTGLADGVQFQVEIIDTWNTAITPVEDVFVTKKKDPDYFVDEKARSVALPGKPCLALRIRRVGSLPGKATNNEPPPTE